MNFIISLIEKIYNGENRTNSFVFVLSLNVNVKNKSNKNSTIKWSLSYFSENTAHKDKTNFIKENAKSKV